MLMSTTNLTSVQLRGRSISHFDEASRIATAATIVERGCEIHDVPASLAAAICGVARGAVVRELRRRGQAPRTPRRRSPTVAACVPVIAAAPVVVRELIASSLPAETLLDLATKSEAHRHAAE
jgi:hypothetical protein